jgi:MFS family permease
MTRLARMVRVLLLFESAMYTALTPLLPHYAHTLHASTAAVGLLAAGYSAGLVPGAVLGGRLATRYGVRRTTLAGLVGFGLSVAAFGLVGELAALDALRVLQGLFCGLIWGGGLTWVIAEAPADRRGAVIAGAVGASTFGTLLGPLLGTLAVTVSPGAVFGGTGAVALGLAGWASRHPEPAWRPPVGAIGRQLRAALRAGGFGLGVWLIALEGIFFGAAGVLLPLRMAQLGAPSWEIGAAFVGASALATALSPLVGRTVDARGGPFAIVIGLAAGAPLLAALLLPTSPALLGVLVAVALGGPMTASMIPAVSLLTEATERAAVTLVLATGAVNLAYAVGETLGAPVAAGISQATGDAIPLILIAVLMLATLPLVRRAGRPAPAPAPAPEPQSGRGRRRATNRLRAGDAAALHTARAATAADPQRRARGGDRRRADLPHRPSAVRLGSESAAPGGDPAGADPHPTATAERR